MGEACKDALRLDFDRKLKLEFHGTKVTSDAGLPAYPELDGALGLTSAIDSELRDIRTGKNTCACQAGMGPPRMAIYLFKKQAFTILISWLLFSASKCYNSSVELTFISGLSSKSRGHDQKHRYH